MEPTYLDDKGNTLYGFSQVSLDKNTYWTKVLVIMVGVLTLVMAGFLLFGLWMVNYVISHGVVNNIVARCVC